MEVSQQRCRDVPNPDIPEHHQGADFVRDKSSRLTLVSMVLRQTSVSFISYFIVI